MIIDYQATALTLAGCIHLLIAIFLIYKRPKDRSCRIFAFFNFLTAGVLITDAMIFTSKNAHEALGYVLVYEFFINLTIPVLTLFFVEFAKPELESRRLDIIAKILIWFGMGLFIFDRTPFVIQEALSYHGGWFIRAIPAQYFLAGLYVICFIVSFYVLRKAFERAEGYRLYQFKIVFFSLAIAVSFFVTYFGAPNGLSILPIGYFGSFIAAFGITYSILKYRLLNIEVVIKKGIVYSVSTAAIAGLYVAIILLGGQMLHAEELDGTGSISLTLLAIVVIAVVFEPIRRGIQSVVDKIFFKTRYEYQEAMRAFSRMVVTILDLDILLDKTVKSIRDILKVSKAVVFLKNAETEIFEIAAYAGVVDQEAYGWHYGPDSDLVKQLSGGRRILENADGQAGNSISIALTVHRRLIGFILIGDKLSGDVFAATDTQLLKTLADQLAIAVENARLYRAAVTDKLTGLFDGAYFYNRLDEEVARSGDHKTPLSMIVFDVDGFTGFAKARGMGVADNALVLVAETIKSQAHVFDVAARVGDDEFALILPGTAREGAAFMAGSIKKKVSELIVDGEPGLLHISFGLAYTENAQKSPRRLSNDARIDLLKHKETPRGGAAKKGLAGA